MSEVHDIYISTDLSKVFSWAPGLRSHSWFGQESTLQRDVSYSLEGQRLLHLL